MTFHDGSFPARAVFLWVLFIGAAEPASAQLPRARANDHRTTAGRMVDGELRVSLEAVTAEWRPRGEDGPVLTAALFAEEGGVPMAPGPMIRVAGGTPVRVTIRNTLDRPMTIGGLGDRGGAPAPGAPPDGPAFLRATFMRLEPGQSREVRFTPADAVTSLYVARVLGPRLGRPEVPTFNGAFIVDPTDVPAPLDERILMISAGVLDDRPSVKTFINGMSWPFTERLTQTVGDTVRWRVINGSDVAHPMHLHGFYFNVDARGDGATDTVYAGADRPLVVTDTMPEFSTMRMTWVAAEQGNWLFHCHLIRHMGEVQLFDRDRAARVAPGHDHPEHEMAGLVMGITVRPRPGVVTPEPEPARRMDVWTSTRPGVFAEGPAHGFVLQDGAAVPAPDAADGIGSTLVLRQGEPTRIVVHNRLPFALSMHWHGLELRSDYDGVGHWSGTPASPRAPIAPGDSRAVLITPPRAGTFMYHTHGEPGYELSQGLYGGFLVLGPNETLDPARDRLFLLASRGAVLDAAPAINGQEQPPPQRFTKGHTVRLRFAHISADDQKTVRLLHAGREVRWRARAKDGADLPTHLRVDEPARLELGVGETRDVEWTPEQPGVHVLEVRTAFYPERTGAQVQRVAFAVGDVTEAAITAAVRGTDLPVRDLDAAMRGRYPGLFTGAPRARASHPDQLRVFLKEGQLVVDGSPEGTATPDIHLLIPLGADAFAYGQAEDGVITQADPTRRARFVGTAEAVAAVEIVEGDAVVARLERVADVVLSPADRDRLVGVWANPGAVAWFRTEREGHGLALVFPNRRRHTLIPVTGTRFLAPSMGPGGSVEFEVGDTGAVSISFLTPGNPPFTMTRTQ